MLGPLCAGLIPKEPEELVMGALTKPQVCRSREDSNLYGKVKELRLVSQLDTLGYGRVFIFVPVQDQRGNVIQISEQSDGASLM